MSDSDRLSEINKWDFKSESSGPKVIYQFDLSEPNHGHLLTVFSNARRMYSALDDIQVLCRNEQKYGENEKSNELAQKISEILWPIMKTIEDEY